MLLLNKFRLQRKSTELLLFCILFRFQWSNPPNRDTHQDWIFLLTHLCQVFNLTWNDHISHQSIDQAKLLSCTPYCTSQRTFHSLEQVLCDVFPLLLRCFYHLYIWKKVKSGSTYWKLNLTNLRFFEKFGFISTKRPPIIASLNRGLKTSFASFWRGDN